MTYDVPIERFLTEYCETFEVDRAVFIEGLIVDQMARLAAMEESGRPLQLLQYTRDGNDQVLRGRVLFFFLLSYYKGEIGLCENLEAEMQHRAELAKDRMAAWNKMKAEQADERIPDTYTGCPEIALEWIAELDAGEISQEMLDERFEAHAKYGGWAGDHEDEE